MHVKPLYAWEDPSVPCPHANIIFCPLYIASHDGKPGSCVYGEWALGCAVMRGEVKYADLLGKLTAVDPRLVAETKWEEDAAAAKAQRARNMRAACAH
jgi:hypothetical protein